MQYSHDTRSLRLDSALATARLSPGSVPPAHLTALSDCIFPAAWALPLGAHLLLCLPMLLESTA